MRDFLPADYAAILMFGPDMKNEDKVVFLEETLAKLRSPVAEQERTVWARDIGPEGISRYVTALGVDAGINDLIDVSHGVSVVRGWHNDLATGLPKPADVPKCIALIRRELSEAIEGWSRNLPDEKLPEFSALEVELADALHRIFDLAGSLGLRLGEAYVEKAKFNLVRKDHSAEARKGEHGKKI